MSDVDIFISADWSVDPDRRAVVVTDLPAGRIYEPPRQGAWDLDAVLCLATSFGDRAVWVGVDAVLGFPAGLYADLLAKTGKDRSTRFSSWLSELPSESSILREESRTAADWSVEHPFFHVPPGKGSRRAFEDAAGKPLLRRIDDALGARSPFILSGIPGSVGSGTRCLWREIRRSWSPERFVLWPFQDPAPGRRAVTVCETYPAAACAVAIADALPAPRLLVAKTDPVARVHVLLDLSNAPWRAGVHIASDALHRAAGSEDVFDALVMAAAVMRCVRSGIPLVAPHLVDPVAEGAVIPTGCLLMDERAVRYRTDSTTRGGSPRRSGTARAHPCPIPGCDWVGSGSRGGWDAHVGSPRNHPGWHPEERDPERRKALFRAEFVSWFE